ncbi:DsbA family oxidoreductase [Burkholderia pseudomallei]|uniref:DsbA family oxidoreductase n=1 Tax=Burkholderia pseudomallei TaxID=28450 RepID=UPI0001736841|nr:DsbA family oxidoreductase [Burkholderia pseudomallei]AIP01621.1 DSBA-like thioredoxin domain protein [Burkholderia pseudomallei]AUG26183.1 DsbA family oxidoreductase [Burkholderia pseudomallei]EDU10041.1 thioredoxin domain protein [Burkholderia pseudomallei 1655]OMZ49245.1 thioredoxin [Burkholderia pseudomallei]OMZ53754.1 thioredoxin [Burkholderia pseudomallei]
MSAGACHRSRDRGNRGDQLGDARPRKLTVECWFDFVCPWCWIGKRHLHAAVDALRALRPDVRAEIVWHPYRLLPDVPRGGLPYDAFYRARLGGGDAVDARRAQVRQAGREARLEFAFERIRTMPNTHAAHAFVGAAADAAHAARVDVDAMIERIFAAFFAHGRDIGDVATLECIALESGLPQHTLPSRLGRLPPRSPRPLGVAHRDIAGVPAFRFGGRETLSGARSPAVLLHAMLRSLRA